MLKVGRYQPQKIQSSHLNLTNLSISEDLVVVFSNHTIKKGNLLFGYTIEMKYPSDRVFEAVQTTRCATCFRARLHEGGGPQGR